MLLLGIYSRKLKFLCLPKDLHKNAHSSFIHNKKIENIYVHQDINDKQLYAIFTLEQYSAMKQNE